MQKTINGIIYRPRAESNARLISIPKEGQTPLVESQESINARSYQLSERNGANAYIIPIEKEKVYLNFIAQKIFVDDSDIREILHPEFEYFIENIIEEVPNFELEDGIIFRCVTPESIPQTKENYTYYIMQDGVAKKIPDYKTLEVMLAERNQNLLSVRVLEKSQCDQVPRESSDGILSKSSAWSQDYADETNLEKFKELEATAKSAGEIVAAAKGAVDQQIATVQAQAAAANSAAAASAAASAAAKAASEAAIAEANAAQAAAEQAKAEAEASKTG